MATLSKLRINSTPAASRARHAQSHISKVYEHYNQGIHSNFPFRKRKQPQKIYFIPFLLLPHSKPLEPPYKYIPFAITLDY
jgi:hypothetical protein